MSQPLHVVPKSFDFGFNLSLSKDRHYSGKSGKQKRMASTTTGFGLDA